MSEALPAFTLERPETVAQAVAAIASQPGSRFIAGGTDLIVNMRVDWWIPTASSTFPAFPNCAG